MTSHLLALVASLAFVAGCPMSAKPTDGNPSGRALESINRAYEPAFRHA